MRFLNYLIFANLPFYFAMNDELKEEGVFIKVILVKSMIYVKTI